MTSRPIRPSLARRVLAVVAPVVVTGLVLSACGDSAAESEITIPPTPRVVVTSIEGDVESQLLAAIYSRALEDAGFRVVRRDPVALDRAGYVDELEAGSIQLIPDWSADLIDWVAAQGGDVSLPTTIVPDATATTAPIVTIATTTTLAASTTVAVDESTTTTPATVPATSEPATSEPETSAPVETTAAPTTTTTTTTTTVAVDESTTTTTITPNGRGSVEQLTALTAVLPDTLSVNSGSLATKNDVIACSEPAIEDHSGVEFSTLTNLASNAPDIVLGAPAGWADDDEFGLGAWDRIYGGEFDDVVTVESDGVAEAIEAGDADCFVLNSLDPVIVGQKLTVMTDDRTMVRANVGIALLSADVATPDLLGALDAVAASLTSDRLVKMLYEITVNGGDPVVVANAFVDTI